MSLYIVIGMAEERTPHTHTHEALRNERGVHAHRQPPVGVQVTKASLLLATFEIKILRTWS